MESISLRAAARTGSCDADTSDSISLRAPDLSSSSFDSLTSASARALHSSSGTAAAMAPTAGNQQLYTILRITDPEKKRRLSESCDHQPFIAEGKLLLVFCADCLKWYEAFQNAGCEPRKPGAGDLLLAVDDALIAAQNAVVAAESYGIGSCYIGDVMENIETQREILDLPEYVFPAAMLVFGYPTEQQMARKKPERVDMRFIVRENSYHRLEPPELREMLGEANVVVK